MKAEDFQPQKLTAKKSEVHSEIMVQCDQQNAAVQCCVNENCKSSSALICHLKSCPCVHSHKKCLKANLQHIAEELTKKIIDTQLLIQAVQKTFSSIVDKLSQLRDDLIQDINQNVKFISLKNIGKQFLQVIHSSSQFRNFTSKDIKILWQLINEEREQKFIFEQISSILKQFEDKQKIISLDMIKLYSDILIRKQIHLSTFNLNQKHNFLPKQISQSINMINMIKDSSIVKNPEQVRNLLGFLSRQLTKFQLIFKASENNFQISNFFEKFGKEKDCLFLVKTNTDKVIGGYTPLCHKQFSSYSSFYSRPTQLNENQCQWIKDSTGQSFVFSLTNNDKFSLKRPQFAIARYMKNSHIQFGDELSLCDKSNVSLCFGQLSGVYQNPNYNDRDPVSYVRYHGNTTREFTTKQWEVWKVIFK